jgi:pimeloyl-ACP methyl ester carboxylesterase
MAAIKYRACLQLHGVFFTWVCVIPLMLLAVMLTAARPASTAPMEFQQAPCWFSIPRDRDMTCGHLMVPENRTKQNSLSIKLPVVVFEPDRVRHEPVVYLSGGPGEPARIESTDEIKAWWSFIDNSGWLRGRRLIVFDQRGVGLSQPSLSCSEHHDPMVWGGIVSKPGESIDFDVAQRREVAACRDSLLSKGIDLTAYNTSENAADVYDLRVALNINRWVLFGISYGTKVALQVLEDHPENIVALVLDSTLPLDVDYVDQNAANFDAALKKLEKDCDTNSDCVGNAGNLRAEITGIVEQLDAQPVLLHLKSEGQPSTFTRVSGDDFLELLFNQFYDRDSIEHLPQLIKQTADQDYSSLAQVIGLNGLGDDGDAFADGMHISVVCNDGVTQSASFAQFPMLDHWARENFYSWACPLWPSGKPARPHRSLAENNVPVLLLSGDYDPATPSSWAEQIVKNTGHSQMALFRGVGHDVIDTTECGGEVVANFLANPDAKVATQCLGDMADPAFSAPEDNSGVLVSGSALPSMRKR